MDCFYNIQSAIIWVNQKMNRVQTLFWSGNCGVLWAIAWCSFGANHPKECFYIDRNERKYIQEHQRYTAKYGVVKEIPWTNIS
uniref:Inorganic phosphate cotransporter n=1 Tax=Triatoma infestans TaxID=30076 RepID=A0A161MMD6_TRIIF